VYAFSAAIAAWLVAEYTTISILDLLLFGFAMVVPPAVSLGYLVYWRRTTEAGAYWGMAVGYASGLIWFGSIKFALATGFAVPADAGLLWRTLAYGLTVDGEGLDPSYLTFFVPLVVVPIVSRLTSQTGAREDFYEMLSGRKPVPPGLV
jgi:Na+/proline symporter